MGDQKQSQGREDNGALPVDQWDSKGVAGKQVQGTEGSEPTTQPYGQKEGAERTGRTEEVTGEARSFKDADKGGGSPHDLLGPAGDPAEGKRKPGDSYPA